jgi:3-hydroxyacyl-[acyl-carrier-protein] dehydratase
VNEKTILEILNLLPHRYPFLLVDKIADYKKDEYLIAIKNVTINEPFFQGHFPHLPVMPGVLILEAMAQASALLVFKNMGIIPKGDALYLFVGIDKARFKKTVGPGDRLEIKTTIKNKKRDIWFFDAVATVDGAICCTAELMCAYKE